MKGLVFALPLRSHIKHKYAYITDKINKCGIDFSKAVVITKAFKKYLKDYKQAIILNTDRKEYTYKFSSLQYFHKELGLDF